MESKRINPDNGKYTLSGCKREVKGLIGKRIMSEASSSQLDFSNMANKGFLDYLMKVVDYSLYYRLDIHSNGTHFANPDMGTFSLTLLEYVLYSKALKDIFEFDVVSISPASVGVVVSFIPDFGVVDIDNELMCSLFMYSCKASEVLEQIKGTVSDLSYTGEAKKFMQGTFVDYYMRYAVLEENFFVVDIDVCTTEMDTLLARLSKEDVITYRKPDEFRAYMYFKTAF